MSLANLAQAAQAGPIERALTKWRMLHEVATGRKPDGYWHPSGICKCPTAAVYEYLGFPAASTPFDARLLRIFDVGHALHAMLQHQFIQAGIVPDIVWPIDGPTALAGTVAKAVEVPLRDDHYRLLGTLDVILNVGGSQFVGEIKTKHSGSFAKTVVPEEAHKIQVACYHWKASEYGLVNTERTQVIYFSKDDSHIKELPHVVTDVQILSIKKRLDTMNNMVEDFKATHTVPEPFYTEAAKPPCRGCRWAQACHGTMFRETWTNQIKDMCNAQPPAAPAQASPAVVKAKGPAKRLPVRR